MDVEVNLLGVALATVGAMAVGFVWYSKPVFGSVWMKLAKVNEKKAKEMMPQAMVAMLVLAAVAAYAIAFLTYIVGFFYQGDGTYMEASIKTALGVWAGFALYFQVAGAMFEQRPTKLIAINVGSSLVTFLVMGYLIGMVGL